MPSNLSVPQLYQRVNQLAQEGRWEEAKSACDDLVIQVPHDAIAWYCCGEIARARGDGTAAVNALRQATSLAPHNLQYLQSLCEVLAQARLWDDAVAACRKFLAHDSRDGALWALLASAEEARGQTDQALAAYENAWTLAPAIATGLSFANVLCLSGIPHRAVSVLQSVLALEAQSVAAWLGLATAQLLLGNYSHAAVACRNALRHEPASSQASLLLAIALLRQWQLPEAETAIRELLSHQPTLGDAWALLATALRMQGRADEAIHPLRQAIHLGGETSHHSQLLLSLQYLDGQSAATLHAAHQNWGASRQRQVQQLPIPFHAKSTSSPLRLGLVSGDLGNQATTYLALPFVEALDKSECSLVIYSDRNEPDNDFTLRFRAASAIWHRTARWSTQSIVRQVRNDEIDVLIDLMGHTGSRLDVFAARAAPVQLTWLGYVGTTGLPQMDYLLADRFHVRPGEESAYVERVLRMPHGYACYHPLVEAPPVSPLPALTQGVFTFGSFNNPAKFNAPLFAAWAEILRAVPASRLLLKYGGLEHPHIQANIRAKFARQGIEPNRIQFAGWTSPRDLFACYRHVDLALDTQPYSGGVTTCESLWMGVPVITFPGQTFASRHSTSHLSNAGYPQYVAGDLPAYRELAVTWANRPIELAAIRNSMRSQLQASPLGNARQFAANFIAMIHELVAAR